MNSNNRFGKCCNCPALMSDSRLFTNWETSKTYNYKLGLKLNAESNTEYKNKLLTNPDIELKDNNNINNDSIKCYKNKMFNDDSTLYHKQFTDNIFNEMSKEIIVRPFYSFEYADY